MLKQYEQHWALLQWIVSNQHNFLPNTAYELDLNEETPVHGIPQDNFEVDIEIREQV